MGWMKVWCLLRDGIKGGGDHMRDDRSLVGWFVPLSSSDSLSLITEDEPRKDGPTMVIKG